MLLVICAMDYLGNDRYPNADTPGLIVDNVSYLEQQSAYRSIFLISKIMRKRMVEPLPRWCWLTALFDVSQVRPCSDPLSTLTDRPATRQNRHQAQSAS